MSDAHQEYSSTLIVVVSANKIYFERILIWDLITETENTIIKVNKVKKNRKATKVCVDFSGYFASLRKCRKKTTFKSINL